MGWLGDVYNQAKNYVGDKVTQGVNFVGDKVLPFVDKGLDYAEKGLDWAHEASESVPGQLLLGALGPYGEEVKLGLETLRGGVKVGKQLSSAAKGGVNLYRNTDFNDPTSVAKSGYDVYKNMIPNIKNISKNSTFANDSIAGAKRIRNLFQKQGA